MRARAGRVGVEERGESTQGPPAPSPHFRIIATERREQLGLSSLPLSYVTVALESFPCPAPVSLAFAFT